MASCHLPKPFSVATLVERRKALLLAVALIENDLEPYGFDDSVNLLKELRTLCAPEHLRAIETTMRQMAQLAFPLT